MRVAAANLLLVWLIFLIGWIGGMFYAGELILLPPSDMGPVEWTIFFAGMYILPLAAALLLWADSRKRRKSSKPHA